MIRRAEEKDIEQLLSLGKEAISLTPWGIDCVEEDLEETLKGIINSPEEQMTIFVYLLPETSKDEILGTFGAVMIPSFWNYAHLEAKQLFWWVPERNRKTDAGTKLFQAFENWAAHYLADDFSTSEIDKLIKLAPIFKRKGYTKSETHFVKKREQNG
jgi:hypothetical protein